MQRSQSNTIPTDAGHLQPSTCCRCRPSERTLLQTYQPTSYPTEHPTERTACSAAWQPPACCTGELGVLVALVVDTSAKIDSWTPMNQFRFQLASTRLMSQVAV